jgi:hypothetical protein
MSGLPILHEWIADRLTASGAVSNTVGPGMMARCARVSIQIRFGLGGTQGNAEIQWFVHQSMVGTPTTIGSVAWSAQGSGDAVDIPSKYFNGFIRVKNTISADGEGMSAWVSGHN